MISGKLMVSDGWVGCLRSGGCQGEGGGGVHMFSQMIPKFKF